MNQKLTLSAIVVGGAQFFLQSVESQHLFEGKWVLVASIAVAAIMLMINSMIHMRDKTQNEQPPPAPPVFVPVAGPDFRPAGPPQAVPPFQATAGAAVSAQMSQRMSDRLK